MPPVRLDRDGDVAEIVLDAPPLNLFDDARARRRRRGAVDAVEADLPRALIVRAEGKVFTAGVDVHIFEGLDAAGGDGAHRALPRLTHRIEALPLPTLAVAHGLCLTAGFELSLACDLLWAARGSALRARGEGGGDHPADGRDAAGGRPRRRGAGARAGDDRRPLHRRDAARLGRGEPRARPRRPARRPRARFAAGLAAGPTRAHAATKAVVKAQADHGVRRRGRAHGGARPHICSRRVTPARRSRHSSHTDPARPRSPESEHHCNRSDRLRIL